MCGITAILSKVCINHIKTLNSLKALQNRGYDSAGIFSLDSLNNINNIKFASNENESGIDKVSKVLDLKNIKSNVFLGHTRWATHGGKTDINAHPHLDTKNQIAIVHNGIIENFMELKKFLIDNDYKFNSETDTEVIVNLISYNYQQCQDFKKAILETHTRLKGTWGLVIFNLKEPNKLYSIRKGSPLLVGQNNHHVIITSEMSGFCNYVENYFIVKENDLIECFLNENEISVYHDPISEVKKVKNGFEELDETIYEHWTIKEIHEQPESINRALNFGARIHNNNIKLGGLEKQNDNINQIDHLIILGCGTSLHAGSIGKILFDSFNIFISISAMDGAEFSKKNIPRSGKSALLLLSQSGETKDLHRCIEIGRESDLLILSIVNVVDSMIAREADCGVYLNAGREVGVASTKSFVSQVIIIKLIAIWISQQKNTFHLTRNRMINNLRNLSEEVKIILDNFESNIKILSQKILNTKKKSLFILGKGENEWIAKEGALKIKEISYLHAEGYSASALKHGPFALLETNTPVIFIAPEDSNYKKVINAIEEVKARNAMTIVISNKYIENVDYLIQIPENKDFFDILSIVVLQLLAYYLSVDQGINPDFPRNLAKVVTVE